MYAAQMYGGNEKRISEVGGNFGTDGRSVGILMFISHVGDLVIPWPDLRIAFRRGY